MDSVRDAKKPPLRSSHKILGTLIDSCLYAVDLGRVMGVVAIVVGTIAIGFNPNRWDIVILDLPRGGHGIHLHDVVGVILVTLGISVLWLLPRSG